MDKRVALRWTLLNRAIAAGALVGGFLLVAVGFVVGFGSGLSTLLADPFNPGDAIAASSPGITAAFALLGVVVWQVGKTYALFVTVPQAAGQAAAEEFDSERLKSEVLEALDGRLAKMEEDVQETRRSVQELKRAEHAAVFDEREHLESTPTESAAGSSTASAGSGADRPTRSADGSSPGPRSSGPSSSSPSTSPPSSPSSSSKSPSTDSNDPRS